MLGSASSGAERVVIAISPASQSTMTVSAGPNRPSSSLPEASLTLVLLVAAGGVGQLLVQGLAVADAAAQELR